MKITLPARVEKIVDKQKYKQTAAIRIVSCHITVFSSLAVKEVTKINSCLISSVVGNLSSAISQVCSIRLSDKFYPV